MEGAELEVLKGGLTLLKTVRTISTEVNFRKFRKEMCQFNTLRAFLEEQGFTLFKLGGNPQWQANALFIRN